MKVAILTISDRCSRQEATDTSGPALARAIGRVLRKDMHGAGGWHIRAARRHDADWRDRFTRQGCGTQAEQDDPEILFGNGIEAWFRGLDRTTINFPWLDEWLSSLFAKRAID